MKAPLFILKIILLSQVLSFCLHLPALSQYKTDSLLEAVNKEDNLTNKIKLYFKLASQYNYTNADSSIIFNKLALKYAIALNNDSLIGQAYSNMAVAEAERNNYKPALINADSAFKYFQLSTNNHSLSLVRNVQGGVNMSLGRNELAFQMYFDALKYTGNDTANRQVLIIYTNLSTLLNNMKKHFMALEYGMKQYNLAKKLKLEDEIGFACANIADTYAELDSPLAAKPFILELNKVAEKSEDPYLKVIAKNELGTLYLYEKNYSKAALIILNH